MMAQVLYLPWRCSISILILAPDQRKDSRIAASDFGLVHEKNAFEDTGLRYGRRTKVAAHDVIDWNRDGRRVGRCLLRA